MQRILLMALAACFILVGSVQAQTRITNPERQAVVTYFNGILRDPESARWNFQIRRPTPSGAIYICGMVNARNGFGGYAGDNGFWVLLENGRATRGDVMGVGMPAPICAG